MTESKEIEAWKETCEILADKELLRKIHKSLEQIRKNGIKH